MNIYITSGTFDYLRNFKLKHTKEKLILLHGEGKTVLLEENEHGTIFKEPRKYEVVDGIGELVQEGFVVMNNIPVAEESRPRFEHMFTNRADKVENQAGFQALRILRPIGSQTYIILTQWHKESAFNAWQSSQSLKEGHSGNAKTEYANSSQKMFTGEAFLTKFSAPVFEEEQ
ncbi:MAG: antibiotic biosynthesis monooxygenase family protein [Bacillus sp. (in: firmicutes)]